MRDVSHRLKIKGIFLIAGHNIKRPGAIAYNGITEHEYNVRLQHRMFNMLKPYSVDVVMDSKTDTLSEIVKNINNFARQGWVVLDIHHNNNNPDATGCEVFVNEFTTPANKNIATAMAKNVSNAINVPLRVSNNYRKFKYSTESNVKSLYIVDKTIIPAILIEPIFLNERDLAKYDEVLVAKALIDAYQLRRRIYGNYHKTEHTV